MDYPRQVVIFGRAFDTKVVRELDDIKLGLRWAW